MGTVVGYDERSAFTSEESLSRVEVRESVKARRWRTTAAHGLVSLGFLAAAYGLFYWSPVTYAYFVTEDYWAEYATAAAFALAGLVLIVLAASGGRRARRVAWLVVGAGFVGLGAEEISWGQRILDIDTPELLAAHNLQGELTIHNLQSVRLVNDRLHWYLAFALALWGVASWGVGRWKHGRSSVLGALVAPGHLAPWLVVTVFLLLTQPLPNSDELAELGVGLLALFWAGSHVVTRLHERRRPAGGLLRSLPASAQHIVVSSLLLALVAAAAAVLTERRPGIVAWRLNRMAQTSYPARGLHEQSDQIFDHLYANPKWVRPETRIVHAELLAARGETERASELLRAELAELDRRGVIGGDSASWWRRRAIVGRLLGDGEGEARAFSRAIASDRLALDAAPSSEQRAHRLWSLSRTMAAAGQRREALEHAEAALGEAPTAHLRNELDAWIEELRHRHGPPATATLLRLR